MLPYLLAVLGAAVAVLAFPPYGIWPLAVLGPAMWLVGLRRATSPRQGLLVGLAYGTTFFGGLIWWISELGLEAVIPLVLSQAAFAALMGWALVRFVPNESGHTWWLSVAALWAVIEFVRYRFPVGGFEWGALGYALSDVEPARAVARWIGTSGLTVVAMAAAAGISTLRGKVAAIPVILGAAVLGVGSLLPDLPAGEALPVAIVQGSTPCPFTHCPDERLGTFRQHLELTRTIETGATDLIVWSEGSTGSFNADPVNNPEVGEAIRAEAARIGTWMVVGGDRPVSETHWVNANVLFSPEGEIVGEYRKQHPVPFGEYIPARPFFEWIPALDQVPRDMIPGDGPVAFDLGDFDLGTVISFEGGFGGYTRAVVREGADLLVVATNQGSYGYSPAADQFIGMTRMRSAETGLDLLHSAVTGKSTIITDGGVVGETTGLATQEVLHGEVRPRPDLQTMYVRFGDWVTVLAGLIGVVAWTQSRRNQSSRDNPPS